MRTIGLVGGMSWESSALYYRIINEEAARVLGGLHSARSIMYSFDFDEIERLQREARWDEATKKMIGAAQSVERAGADLLVIATNTMHLMADDVEAAIGIPLLHIADPTAKAIRDRKLQRIGLLGTRFTMEEDFYRGRLEGRFGLEVLTPAPSQRDEVHRVIYEELCLGKVVNSSRESYVTTIDDLIGRGAEGIILGCTEIGLLVDQSHSGVPLFDTTELHAKAAVRLALGGAA